MCSRGVPWNCPSAASVHGGGPARHADQAQVPVHRGAARLLRGGARVLCQCAPLAVIVPSRCARACVTRVCHGTSITMLLLVQRSTQRTTHMQADATTSSTAPQLVLGEPGLRRTLIAARWAARTGRCGARRCSDSDSESDTQASTMPLSTKLIQPWHSESDPSTARVRVSSVGARSGQVPDRDRDLSLACARLCRCEL